MRVVFLKKVDVFGGSGKGVPGRNDFSYAVSALARGSYGAMP